MYEYRLKFDDIMFLCSLQMSHYPTTYMFYNDLRTSFKSKMILYIIKRHGISFGFKARIVF